MSGGAPLQVLVLYERGPNGAATLTVAAGLVRGSPAASLTVVTLAPTDTQPGSCVVYTEPFNAAIRGQASLELSEAQSMIGALGQVVVAYESLSGRRDPLARRVAGGRWNLVLVPARGLRYRLPFGAGRRLRRAARCEVGVVRADRPWRRGSRGAGAPVAWPQTETQTRR
jgi:hypothetical protein